MNFERDAATEANRIGGALTAVLSARWDGQQFIFNGNHAVSVETIRNVLIRVETVISGKIGKLVDELEATLITHDQWQADTKRLIASSHIIAAALACGSIRTAAYDLDVMKRIKTEFEYFDKFAEQVKNDVPTDKS